jgi:hypothetical protein
MKSAVESVIDSYEAQVRAVAALMRQTLEVLRNLGCEQEKKVLELCDLLARVESLKRKDFDTLIAEIWAQRREKEGEIGQTLESFLIEQQELVAWLRMVVSDGYISLEEFRLLSQNMLTRQKEQEGKLSRMLRELHLEQEELGAGLKKLLGKGEKVRIKDFKALIKAVQLRQGRRRDKAGKMLDELWRIDEEVAIQWRKVMSSTRVKI